MSKTSILQLIQKKKEGQAFTRDEINFIVKNAVNGHIPDYQLSALLMAIYFQHLTPEETRDLTLSMAQSGDIADLSSLGVCVDKHSTGGVGDTTTLVLTPLCAACGAKVAKMSGRGLGHTGGTLDKLESIPGFTIEMKMSAFIRQVREIGCAVIGQSQNIAPADKLFYGLRDATATVDSVPLIVSSIMSKKIAAGSHAIVLDVKTGSGALMRSLDESIALAKSMVEVGALSGKRMMALVTGMDQPLGTHIGNALEVKEAINILAGRTKGRLLELSLTLGAMMLVTSGLAENEAEARIALHTALKSGRGRMKLAEMIAFQHGNPNVTMNLSLLPTATRIVPVPAAQNGFVNRMDTTALGEASRIIGAGRVQIDDIIDPAVGIVMSVSLGDSIQKGQPAAYLHVNDNANMRQSFEMVQSAITISNTKEPIPPLVYAEVRPEGVKRLI